MITIVNTNPQSRLFFVDFLKALSITAVVSYHSLFVPKSTYADSALLIDSLFSPLRFCVPVLLTISFMLFERGLSINSAAPISLIIKKRLTRLAVPTVFWFSLVAGLKILSGNSSAEIAIEIFQGEIFTGAYYLIILFQLMPLYILIRPFLSSLKNLLLILFIQILVFIVVYSILNIESAPQTTAFLINMGRTLFIYWFVYAALGGFLSNKISILLKISSSISLKRKALILIFTYLTFMTERIFLNIYTKSLIEPFEYIMLSCVFSTIILFLCFSAVEEKQLPLFLIKGVKLLSKYSLGIFCINGILYLYHVRLISYNSRIYAENGKPSFPLLPAPCSLRTTMISLSPDTILFLLSLSTHLLKNTVFDFTHILLLKVCGWGLLLVASLSLSILIGKIGLKRMVC
jgi:hypothetical protein